MHVRKGGRNEQVFVAVEDLAVGLHAAVGQVWRRVRVELREGIAEGQANGVGAGRRVGYGQPELSHGGLYGAHDVVSRVGQCAVEIEDD